MTVKEDAQPSAPQAPVEPEIVLTDEGAYNDPPFAEAIATEVRPPAYNPEATYTTASNTTTTTYTIPPPSAPESSYQYTHAPSNNLPSQVHRLGGLGRHSTQITCPYCNEQSNTVAEVSVDFLTIMIMIILILVFWPLFWLPLVIPGCKSVKHHCRKCKREVGRTPPCEGD